MSRNHSDLEDGRPVLDEFWLEGLRRASVKYEAGQPAILAGQILHEAYSVLTGFDDWADDALVSVGALESQVSDLDEKVGSLESELQSDRRHDDCHNECYSRDDIDEAKSELDSEKAELLDQIAELERTLQGQARTPGCWCPQPMRVGHSSECQDAQRLVGDVYANVMTIKQAQVAGVR